MIRLIGVEQAEVYLGIKKSTLYAWAGRRVIPSVKMGRRLLFDLRDLDRMIERVKRSKNSADGNARPGQDTKTRKGIQVGLLHGQQSAERP